jgi:hypothetical protein
MRGSVDVDIDHDVLPRASTWRPAGANRAVFDALQIARLVPDGQSRAARRQHRALADLGQFDERGTGAGLETDQPNNILICLAFETLPGMRIHAAVPWVSNGHMI